MKPVEFENQNTIFGKDQHGVNPLPAFFDPESDVVISCWELDENDLLQIAKNKRIFVSQWKCGQLLQPINLVADISGILTL